MKIQKTSETRALAGHIANEYDNSQNSAYSTEYANQHFEGTILYENSRGTQGDFTLNDDVSNYKKIDIFVKHWHFDVYKTFTIYEPNGKQINLDTTITDDGTFYWTCSRLTITGTNAVVGNTYITNTYTMRNATSFSQAFAAQSNSTAARYYIYKVIGYK